MRLGNYRDAQERAKTVTAQCYSYAKRMFEGNNFEEAAKQFTAIKDYKDSADYAAESLYQYGKILVNEGKYKKGPAIVLSVLETIRTRIQNIWKCGI